MVTYNVLADPVAVDARIPALFRVLHAARPDVLALQEVAQWFLPWLRDTRWLADWHVAELDGAPARPNGQMLLARHPIADVRAQRLSGAQGRTVLIADLDVAGRKVTVATTHMESPLEDGATRARQLDEIFAALAANGADATVLCGDLNFGDGERPDSDHLDPDFVDAWTELRAGEPGFTWNIEVSEMARRGSFVGEPSRRLDRVLLRSQTWRPASIAIVGDAPVVPGDATLFPSDHFGLVAELVRGR